MIPFPNKKYSVIYADPPWKYQDERCEGTAADHYPTMRIEDAPTGRRIRGVKK